MKNLWKIAFATLLIASIWIRFYHLPERAIFTADEEYQATYAKTIVDDFHPVWIGVSAADTGFYLGPYFTYFTAFWLKLSGGDPLLFNYVSGVIGVISVAAIYYLGYLIDSRRTGFIAATLYAFSPLMIYLDQRFWNPSPTPLITVLLLISLIKLKHSHWWLILTAFTLVVIWHIHLSIAPLYFVALIPLYANRKHFRWQSIFLAILTFIIMLAPLIIFDYNHNWSNLLTPLRLLTTPSNNQSSVSESVVALGESLGRSLYLSKGTEAGAEIRPGCNSSAYTVIPLFYSLLSLLPLLIYLLTRNNWKDKNRRLLSITLVIMLASYIFYPGAKATYYALGLFPLYFLTFTLVIPRLLSFVMPLYILISIMTITNTNQEHGLRFKRDLVEQVTTELGTNNFNLSEVGTCYRYGGWRYLFSVYGKSPVTSSADNWIGWLYPSEIGVPSPYTVTIGATGEWDQPTDGVATFVQGGYTAVVTYEP